MPQLITPKTKIQIVPRDGELEITLNINITIDGQVTAQATNAKSIQVEEQEDDSPMFVPEFGSDFKLNFGKNG